MGVSTPGSLVCRIQWFESIFITDFPSFSNIPVNQTINEADTATFHCNATGNPTPKITWLKDGKTMATGDTLSFEANRTHSGKYVCSAENGLEKAISARAYLYVLCTYSRIILKLCYYSNIPLLLHELVYHYSANNYICTQSSVNKETLMPCQSASATLSWLLAY